MSLSTRAQACIKDVKDFPKLGVVFKDIGPLLRTPDVFEEVVQWFSDRCKEHETQAIAGIESRGFLFGSAVALKSGLPFIPIRKPGKLPGEVLKQEYELEYGHDCVEVQKDALRPGDRVMLIDDVLATGGTASASKELLDRLGVKVLGSLFLMELGFLNGRERLEKQENSSFVESLISI